MRPNPQETVDLVTFTEEILNGKLHFLRSECKQKLITLTQFLRNITSSMPDFAKGFCIL